MTVAWVAGTIRGRLLASRRLGREGAHRLATAGDAATAVAALAGTPYGHDVEAGMHPRAAAHAVGATALWNLRVLAGWLGPSGADLVRVLAAGFEITNVVHHLDRLAGIPTDPPYDLGALATAWPRLRGTSDIAQVRSALAASVWGNPGGSTAAELTVGLHLSWARRVVDRVEQAGPWARAGAALLIARERLVAHRPLTPEATATARDVLGARWLGEPWSTPAELAPLVPAEARPLLAGTVRPEDLWLAHGAWRRGIEDDALATVRSGRPGPGAVAAAVALLLVDAARVRGALEAAAWPDQGPEVLDAVG